jgi:hypothetical protein
MTITSSAQLDPAKLVNTAAPGRDCGSCTLCCKVYQVPSLNKPAGKWCQHCLPGKGCGIHETRPDHCRAFFCLWMTETFLGPEWKPDRSKFVISIDPVSRYMMVQVDPGAPKAWRQEPYYSQFRRWAQASAQQGQMVIIFNQQHATALSPSGETELGVLAENDRVGLETRMTPSGPVTVVVKSRV